MILIAVLLLAMAHEIVQELGRKSHAASLSSGQKIMAKVYARPLSVLQAELEMTLIDAENNRSTRHLHILRKDFGDTRKLRLVVEQPEEKAAFLIHDQMGVHRQWWLSVSPRKVSRIPEEAQRMGLLGSDLTPVDLVRPILEDYTFRLMKEPLLQQVPTWQIWRVPRTPQVAQQSGYSRSMLWVRKDNFIIVQAIHWLHENRRMKYMRITRLESLQGVWVPTEVQLITKLGQVMEHGTLLQYRNITLKEKLGEGLFSRAALRRLR